MNAEFDKMTVESNSKRCGWYAHRCRNMLISAVKESFSILLYIAYFYLAGNCVSREEKRNGDLGDTLYESKSVDMGKTRK